MHSIDTRVWKSEISILRIDSSLTIKQVKKKKRQLSSGHYCTQNSILNNTFVVLIVTKLIVQRDYVCNQSSKSILIISKRIFDLIPV